MPTLTGAANGTETALSASSRRSLVEPPVTGGGSHRSPLRRSLTPNTADSVRSETVARAEHSEADPALPSMNAFVSDATRAVLDQLLPKPLARVGASLAKKVLGDDVARTLRSPDPTQKWSGAAFGPVTPLTSTLEGHLAGAAPYFSGAETRVAGPVDRTTLSPAKVAFHPDHLGYGPTRLAAGAAANLELGIVAKTRAYAYVANADTFDFAQVSAEVAKHRTDPRGPILKALAPLLERDRRAFLARGIDVSIVKVPGIAVHPTYVAATLEARDGIPSVKGRTSLILFKRGHTASSDEVQHLDAFARTALLGRETPVSSPVTSPQ